MQPATEVPHTSRRHTSSRFGMRLPMCHTVYTAGLVLLNTVASVAQTVTPTNWTSAQASIPNTSNIHLSAFSNTNETTYTLVNATAASGLSIPLGGLHGSIFQLLSSNQLSLNSSEIALLSCDPVSQFTQPNDLLASAITRDPLAIILYSTAADYCAVDEGAVNISNVYSITSAMWAHALNLNIQWYSENGNKTVEALVTQGGNGTVGNGTAGNSTSTNNNNLPPAPGTAIAMVILYAVTGIITALFLMVIITGAIRAHRNPERYGPRAVPGRARQSRARGLARAMLESLPIVKVGDPTPNKPTDIELANGQHGPVEVLPGQEPLIASPDATTTSATADETQKLSSHLSASSAPATTTPAVEEPDAIQAVGSATVPPTPSPAVVDYEGCSICTEDFQLGEDQRVLPCDHRFHPVCVDPWLLNVSGTCPLCRIDLRANHHGSSPDDDDHHHHDDDDDGDAGHHLAVPPLNATGVGSGPSSRRTSFRRSLLLSITGAPSAAERMSREERIRAVRALRARELGVQAERRRRSSVVAAPAAVTAAAQEEEERSMRSRLRNVFRVRTRRIGDEEVGGGDAAREGADGAAESREGVS